MLLAVAFKVLGGYGKAVGENVFFIWRVGYLIKMQVVGFVFLIFDLWIFGQ